MGTGDRGRPRRGRTNDVRSQHAIDRQANVHDKDISLYARKRASNARRRAENERRQFDPAPPTDDDWTMEDPTSDGLQRVTPPVALNAALEQLLQRRGWARALASATIWTQWAQIVGDNLAQRCEPTTLTRGVLTVRAENQVWATQLRYMTTQLADRANDVLAAPPERPVVTRVTIVVGDVSRERTDQP